MINLRRESVALSEFYGSNYVTPRLEREKVDQAS